jgi:hypothetical protein
MVVQVVKSGVQIPSRNTVYAVDCIRGGGSVNVKKGGVVGYLEILAELLLVYLGEAISLELLTKIDSFELEQSKVME